MWLERPLLFSTVFLALTRSRSYCTHREGELEYGPWGKGRQPPTLLPLEHVVGGQAGNHSVRCAGAGGWCWSGVRERYCWLAGGWRLVLERCERKILLAGWRSQTANRVKKSITFFKKNLTTQKQPKSYIGGV